MASNTQAHLRVKIKKSLSKTEPNMKKALIFIWNQKTLAQNEYHIYLGIPLLIHNSLRKINPKH